MAYEGSYDALITIPLAFLQNGVARRISGTIARVDIDDALNNADVLAVISIALNLGERILMINWGNRAGLLSQNLTYHLQIEEAPFLTLPETNEHVLWVDLTQHPVWQGFANHEVIHTRVIHREGSPQGIVLTTAVSRAYIVLGSLYHGKCQIGDADECLVFNTVPSEVEFIPDGLPLYNL